MIDNNNHNDNADNDDDENDNDNDKDNGNDETKIHLNPSVHIGRIWATKLGREVPASIITWSYTWHY